MATKKKDDISIVVVEGDYFTATHNRKKIRGIVGYNAYQEYFILCNNQSGVDVKCEDEDDNLGFMCVINLVQEKEGTAADLKAAGVNNYTVLENRRQKAVIDKDKLPELGIGQDKYKVSVKDGKYVFGCGAVKLTKEQIEGYLRYREAKSELDDYKGFKIDEMKVSKIEEYLKIKKGIDEDDETYYDEVVEAAQRNYHDDYDINDIDEEDIRALFKYATHVAAGVK